MVDVYVGVYRRLCWVVLSSRSKVIQEHLSSSPFWPVHPGAARAFLLLGLGIVIVGVLGALGFPVFWSGDEAVQRSLLRVRPRHR